MRAAIAALVLLAPAAALAQDAPRIAIVRPGAGYLVADGRSVIPLQIVLTGDGPNVKRARIVPSEGNVSGERVVSEKRVEFLYKPPSRKDAVDEILDVSLTLSNGNRIAEAFTLLIPPRRGPDLEVSASPDSFNTGQPTTVGVAATTSGEGVERLELTADRGTLAPASPGGGDRSISKTTTLELPAELPPDAPSHLMVVAAASSATGYAVKKADISVLAPVRVSVEITPESALVVEGAEIEQEPVIAAADGRTVMDDVIVRYGRRVRVFEESGDNRRELSVVIPSGLVSFAMATPLPGQNVADGGSGPSIAVVVPPSPFGDAPFWADITLEGAKLIGIEDVDEHVKVLVVKRPTESGIVRVLMDDEPVGEIAFGSALGQFVTGELLDADSDERGAVEIAVTDAAANPADHPVPKVRIEGGKDLEALRIGPGRYRVSIPPGTPGRPGEEIEVVADVATPPKVAGEALELATSRTTVVLTGPPPAIKSNDKKIVKKRPPRKPTGIPPKFGVSGAALVGTSFNSLLQVGGGVMTELRLPFLEHRLGVRAGVEFLYGTSSGRVTVGESSLESRTTITGVLVPIDFGFAMVKTESFELLTRVGVAIRVEQGAISVGTQSAGGGGNVGIGGRATAEAGFLLGDGALFIGATLSGLGASANGLSAPGGTKIDGSLTTVRAEVGYRVWF